MDILVKFPTRGRPDLFRQTFLAYNQRPESVRFLVTLDVDDVTAGQTKAFLSGFHNVRVHLGVSKSKIAAINSGLRSETFDLMIMGSDDMIPQRPDYAERIARLFRDRFPEGDGVLHLNDGRAGRTLNTLPIIDRKYFDRFGYVYHPSYTSLWADNEFQEVSERLGRAVYVDEVVIKHEWKDATGADALHVRNESFYDADHKVFLARRVAGFPR